METMTKGSHYSISLTKKGINSGSEKAQDQEELMKTKKSKRQNSLSFTDDLIENLPIGMMILDGNGKIARMNKKQEQISRIEREKVLGRTFEEAFPKALEQGLKELYFKLIRQRIPFDIIIDKYIPQYYSKQMTFHARGSSFSFRKNFILLHELEEELYQEKRLVETRTKELKESKRFLESLIDSSPNIIISTDLTDRIIIFNKTAQKTFGYKQKEVKKEKIHFLFKETHFNEEIFRKNSHTPKQLLCMRKNQSTFPASLSISDIKNTIGKSIAKLYLLCDLTEKKEMEERLWLSEKLALYSELMGGIAHQLNSPLAGVINFSGLLLKEMEEEDPKRELAETILMAGRECQKIITSVLNCIKDPYLTFSKTDINEVLMDSLHSLREQFGDKLKKVSIRTEMDPKILPILGDSIQLKQCFLNILINAMQAMQNGRGSLIIKTEYDEKKGEIKIFFSDSGLGIPGEYIKKIFLPFFSLQRAPGRHGLGLSFAYQVVKNHNGYIYVSSELGLGSTFIIVLSTSQSELKR